MAGSASALATSDCQEHGRQLTLFSGCRYQLYPCCIQLETSPCIYLGPYTLRKSWTWMLLGERFMSVPPLPVKQVQGIFSAHPIRARIR